MRLTKGLRIFLCCLVAILVGVVLVCQGAAWAENNGMVPAKVISTLTDGAVKKPMSAKKFLGAHMAAAITTAHAPQFKAGVLKANLIAASARK
jgi:hypothetical protein